MIGQFDPRFAVDLASGGGEVELLHRLVARGHTLVYEPAALTWYTPRRDPETVRAQVFDQGRAFGLYLLMCFRKRTVGRFSLLSFVLRDWGWKRIARRLRRPGKATRFLVLAELAGALVSPVTLWSGRKRFGYLVADLATQSAAEAGPAPVHQLTPAHAAPPPRPQTDEVGTRATIRIVRTWYPHWGQYSGINQFLKFVDSDRYRVTDTTGPGERLRVSAAEPHRTRVASLWGPPKRHGVVQLERLARRTEDACRMFSQAGGGGALSRW